MGIHFYRFAAEYGTRSEPTIVTTPQLKIVFANRAASAKSVLRLTPDFLQKALSPDALKEVERLQKDKKEVTFTQEFGNKYKETFFVKAQWDKKYLVFTFSPERTLSLEPSLLDSVREGNMNTALQGLMDVSTMAEYTEPSAESLKELAKDFRKATMYTIRCVRQQQYLHKDINCFAFHLPTLLNLLLKPCENLPWDTEQKVHFTEPVGEKNIKCDADIFRYILYSLLSTIMYHTEKDASVKYEEYADFVQIEIFSGKELPIIVQNSDEQPDNEAICTTLGLYTPAKLIEKLQGEMTVRVMEEDVFLSITLPTVTVEGAFKELAHTMLEETISSLEIEFSIL